MHHKLGKPFQSLWLASTSGALADGLAATALPLLMVTLTRDPLTISLLQVASGLPWLVLGLPAGVLADSWDRRRVLWSTDLGRAAVALGLTGVVLAGATSVPVILVAALLYGAGTVLFRSAAPSALPALVDAPDLTRANSRLQIGTTTTGALAGPSLGGVLFTLGAWLPTLTQTGALLLSVGALRGLPVGQPHQGDTSEHTRGPMRAEIAQGLRTVFRDPVLRGLATATSMLAASTGMLLAILVLHVVETLDAPQSSYGLLFTLYATGSLAASAVVAILHSILGTRRCLLASAALGAASLLIIAWAPTATIAAIGMVMLGAATMIYNVLAVTLRQQHTPDRILGRVSSIFNVVGVGSVPVAALAAGVLASHYGTPLTISSGAGLCVFAGLAIATLIPNPDTKTADEPKHGHVDQRESDDKP